MNHWTKLSIEYANQRSYLDDLFQVYPTIPEGIRDIDNGLWKQVEKDKEAQEDAMRVGRYIASKLDVFLADDLMRPILGQSENAIDFNRAMSEKKIDEIFYVIFTTLINIFVVITGLLYVVWDIETYLLADGLIQFLITSIFAANLIIFPVWVLIKLWGDFSK
mgnify:CR=1 FL=1